MNTGHREMLGWTLPEQERYIRGFADGEGWPAFYRDRSRQGHHRPGYVNSRAIFISNTNKPLLQAVRRMLMGLGIESRLYLDAEPGTRKSTITSWKLAILGRENLLRFQEKVGFSDTKKVKTLKAMLHSYRKHGSESLRRFRR